MSREPLWLEFTVNVKHGPLEIPVCGLCGNTGYVDTTGKARSPMGMPCGLRRPCICPNGRAIKRAAKRKEND